MFCSVGTKRGAQPVGYHDEIYLTAKAHSEMPKFRKGVTAAPVCHSVLQLGFGMVSLQPDPDQHQSDNGV
jgi:hypothetical protein